MSILNEIEKYLSTDVKWDDDKEIEAKKKDSGYIVKVKVGDKSVPFEVDKDKNIFNLSHVKDSKEALNKLKKVLDNLNNYVTGKV